MDKKLLKVKEAAAVLSVGQTKLREFIRDGRLSAIKIDGSIRIPMDAIESFIKGNPSAAK